MAEACGEQTQTTQAHDGSPHCRVTLIAVYDHRRWDELDHKSRQRGCTRGGLYAWELERGAEKRQARVEGQVTFNGVYPMINAALTGYGLAFVPDELVEEHVAAGRLQRVMEDWCPTWPGLHLYYPSRRQSSRALTVIVDALRYRSDEGSES